MALLLGNEAESAVDWFTRHRLKLRHLSILLAMERAQNVGRAARELHTSQPAVSRSIKEIERAAGVPLFERRSDGTYPTPSGEALIRYAREIFGTLQRAGREIETIAGGLAGSLYIGCNFSSAADVLPRALIALKRANPRLSVKVREGSIETLLPELRSRELDVVVARQTRAHFHAGFEEHALFEQPMCVICSLDHPLAAAKRVGWKALGQWPWIMPPKGSAVREGLEDLLRSHRLVPQETGIESASVFANIALLRDLRALALTPVPVARYFGDRKPFAVLPMRLPRVFGPNAAITLAGREHTPAMKAFLECLTRTARSVALP